MFVGCLFWVSPMHASTDKGEIVTGLILPCSLAEAVLDILDSWIPGYPNE